MIIVSKEEGAKWPNLGSLTELRGFYGTYKDVYHPGQFINCFPPKRPLIKIYTCIMYLPRYLVSTYLVRSDNCAMLKPTTLF